MENKDTIVIVVQNKVMELGDIKTDGGFLLVLYIVTYMHCVLEVSIGRVLRKYKYIYYIYFSINMLFTSQDSHYNYIIATTSSSKT